MEEKTMSIDELATFLGVNRRTIMRVIKDNNIDFNYGTGRGNKSSLNIQGTKKVVEALYPKLPVTIKNIVKDSFNERLTNVRLLKDDKCSSFSLTDRDKEFVSFTIRETVSAVSAQNNIFYASVIKEISELKHSVNNLVGSQKALPESVKVSEIPEAPIALRGEFVKIVRKYADEKGVKHNQVFNSIYNEMRYRGPKIDVFKRASKAKMKCIEYIEKNDYLREALSVAKAILK